MGVFLTAHGGACTTRCAVTELTAGSHGAELSRMGTQNQYAMLGEGEARPECGVMVCQALMAGSWEPEFG